MIPVIAKRILILGAVSTWRRPLRSLLTILGIVFGVCSVIAMLAIGEGASYEAQEQIRRLGSQNVIVRSVKPPQAEDANASRSFVITYGLTYKDASRIEETIPDIEITVPQRSIRADVIVGRKQLDANLIGTVPSFPNVTNRTLQTGRFFSQMEMDDNRNVCVLNGPLAAAVFPFDDPLGQMVRARGEVFRVVGVLADPGLPVSAADAISYELYVPLSAANSRFGEVIHTHTSGSFSSEKVELHELIARVNQVDRVMGVSEVIRGLLDRYHKDADYLIIVPLELLRQAARTKAIFNIVLGSIAAISLLVGGIGIMNIMLATVTERTREIGIRRALGAKRRDIIYQFLVETVLLSLTGGVIGLGIGVMIPFVITYYSGMKTVIVWWSLAGALGISVIIGLIFGLYPAYRASRMNPITALRHE